MLDDTLIEALEALLFDERWEDSALDYYGFHGAVTANCVAPSPLPPSNLLALVLGCEADDITVIPPAFTAAVEQLTRQLCGALDLDERVDLPPPANDASDLAVAHWCGGFTDVYLADEDAWLAKDQDQIVHWLTPILTLSGLFVDEGQTPPEPQSRLYKQLLQAIPESVKDLYLRFHS